MAYLTRMPRVLRLPTSLKYLLAFTGVATLSGLTLVYLLQCKLIYPAYFPSGSRKKVDFPSLYDMDNYEDVTLTTSDGEELKAYLITRETEETTRKAPTLLYLHANAGNMGHRLPIAKRFHQRFRCNILMLSYRGYGFSTGSPSESGLRIDAQTALNFILGHPLLKNTKIVVYGQSIGGAVAVDLVARNEDKISALMIENTFLSIPKLIPHIFPFFGYFAFLCHQKWKTEDIISDIQKTPILFLSGVRDEIVPPQHMKILHAKTLTTGGKYFNEFNAQHNDTCLSAGYFEVIDDFWARCINKTARNPQFTS